MSRSLELELVTVNLERVVIVQLGNVESDVKDVLGGVVLAASGTAGEECEPGLLLRWGWCLLEADCTGQANS